jgi:hypothetical protein
VKFPIRFDLILRANFYAMPELRFDGAWFIGIRDQYGL